MTFQKFNSAEGKLEVLSGRAANVLNEHFRRTGKYVVSDFSADEKTALDSDLTRAIKEDSAEQQVVQPEKTDEV